MPINESLNLSVLFGGSVKATASTTIVDTSRPAYEYILVPSNPSDTAIAEIDVPTYTITANKTSLNEGETVVFTLTTTKLDTGTTVPYTISGVSVSDISLSSLTGNFITDAAGKATLTLSLIEDVLTEGTETLTISINGQSATRSVTINDTSAQPIYNIGWYSDTAGNNAITQINEGSTAYAVIKTQFVPNGTVVNITMSGTGITSGDFTSNTLSGTITINNNIGYTSWTPTSDNSTEGTEVVTVTAKIGNNTLSSKVLSIIDTSETPLSGTIFKVGLWNQAPTLQHYGYGQNSTTNFGKELSDDLSYGGTFVGLGYCAFLELDSGGGKIGGITINITNSSSIMADAQFKLKLTNLSNNISITTGAFTLSTMSIPGSTVWECTLSDADRLKAKQMFIVDENIRVELISIVTPVTVTASVTTTDTGWTVVRGFNLADEFIKAKGRLPNADEKIILTIPPMWAFVGSNESTPGITIDTRLNNVNSIRIENNGMIAGKGGNGAGGDTSGGRGLSPTDGGTGIKNTSNITVTVYNSNILSGGGGSNGTAGVFVQDVTHGGCGGVPYGYSNRSGRIGYEPLLDSSIGGDYGGAVVRLGMDGVRGNTNFSDKYGLRGFIKEGNVTIINIGNGITKGR